MAMTAERTLIEARRASFQSPLAIVVGLALIALGCALPATHSRSSLSGWSNFAWPELGFSVRFPTPPTEQQRTIETEVGPLVMHIFVSESADHQSAYTVVVAEYPESILDRMTVDQILDTTDDDAQSKPHLALKRFEPTSLGNTPGRELTIEDTQNNLTNELRAYLDGSRLYTVGVTTTRAGESVARARSFFESFQIGS